MDAEHVDREIDDEADEIENETDEQEVDSDEKEVDTDAEDEIVIAEEGEEENVPVTEGRYNLRANRE